MPMGLDDLLLGALTSFAPTLLGGMFQGNDPREALRRQIMQLYSPGNVASQTRAFQSLYPYSGAQTQIANAANNLGNQLGATLGERGLNQSGVGAVGNALARSSGGFQLANLNSQAWQESLANAMRNIQSNAQNLVGYGGVGPTPNYTQQLFGTGLSNFGNYMKQYMGRNQQTGTSPWSSQNLIGPPDTTGNQWNQYDPYELMKYFQSQFGSSFGGR